MPRPRNTATGPRAKAFDASARTLARLDKAREAAVADFHAKLIAAIEDEPPMSFAEAARRSGYTREHLSKLYTKLTGPPEEPKPTGRPRKAARPHVDPSSD